MLIEMLVLFAGVVSRLFRRPFTWSDEFASILFLWLAMLGAVVAFRRGEHMRMSTFVMWSRCSPLRAPVRCAALGACRGLPHLDRCPMPSNTTLSEWVVSTPSLEVGRNI